MRDPSRLDMTGRALQTGYTACTARGKDGDSGQAAWSGAARGGWDRRRRVMLCVALRLRGEQARNESVRVTAKTCRHLYFCDDAANIDSQTPGDVQYHRT